MFQHTAPEGRPLLDVPIGATTSSRPSDDKARIERLVAAAAQSDSRAWSELVARFGPRVRGVARRHGLSSHDVDDVAQTTWLRLFEHIGELREPGSVGGWLETTARRESLRVLRDGGRERPTDEELIQPAPVPPVDEQRIVAAGRRSALQASLANLTERQCRLMRTLLAEPSPRYEDVARSLGIPIGSVGPTRLRCLARLRADTALAAWCAD